MLVPRTARSSLGPPGSFWPRTLDPDRVASARAWPLSFQASQAPSYLLDFRWNPSAFLPQALEVGLLWGFPRPSCSEGNPKAQSRSGRRSGLLRTPPAEWGLGGLLPASPRLTSECRWTPGLWRPWPLGGCRAFFCGEGKKPSCFGGRGMWKMCVAEVSWNL